MIPAAAAAADAATIRRRSGVAGAVDFRRASPNRNCLGYRIRGVGTGMGLMRRERAERAVAASRCGFCCAVREM